jgi:hypothetical protein
LDLNGRKMKHAKTYSIFLVAALLSACEDEYIETTRTLPLGPFTTIDIKSVFSIYLIQDTFYGVEIVGDDDIINHVDATVDGDVLSLVDNRQVKWTTPESNKIKVYVRSPNHGTINAYATYSLYSANVITTDLRIVNQPEVRFSEIDLALDSKSFYYWNNYSCNGRLMLRGQCESFTINNYALHAVDASGLNAQSGILTTYAKAACSVNVANQFTCSVHGQGNIYVHGNPAELIVKEITSSGQVIKVN